MRLSGHCLTVRIPPAALFPEVSNEAASGIFFSIYAAFKAFRVGKGLQMSATFCGNLFARMFARNQRKKEAIPVAADSAAAVSRMELI